MKNMATREGGREEGKNNRKNMSEYEGKNNTPSHTDQFLKTLAEEEVQRKAADRIVGARFMAWFHHWILQLRSIIKAPMFQEHSLTMEIGFILWQFEHHFTASDAPRKLRNAFRYLRHYFRFYPCATLKQSRKAEEMLTHIEESRSSNVQKAGAEVRAWFGNRIYVVLRAIENPKLRETNAMMENKFFLKALEMFFVETERSLHFRNAFRYLKHYFRVYPLVRRRQSEKAVEMIARIYQGLDYPFRYQAHIKPGISEIDERMPQGIDRSTQGRGAAPVRATA